MYVSHNDLKNPLTGRFVTGVNCANVHISLKSILLLLIAVVVVNVLLLTKQWAGESRLYWRSLHINVQATTAVWHVYLCMRCWWLSLCTAAGPPHQQPGLYPPARFGFSVSHSPQEEWRSASLCGSEPTLAAAAARTELHQREILTIKEYILHVYLTFNNKKSR